MNATQREQVIAAILDDCDIVEAYVNTEGKTCAIGGLCKAAGLPIILDEAVAWNITSIKYGGGVVDNIRKGLQEFYGLTIDQQQTIQDINDRTTLPGDAERLGNPNYQDPRMKPECRELVRQKIVDFVNSIPLDEE